MSEMQHTISPVDQSTVISRPLPTPSEVTSALELTEKAFKSYSLSDLDERIVIASKFLDLVADNREQMSQDLSRQMGRPISGCGVEVDGTVARGRYMISIAKQCLGDVKNEETDTATHIRYIKKCPVGPVLVISPWNYPYFCQINAVLPALLAGNSVILKPSPQTPLCGEIFQTLYTQAGLPEGTLQVLHLSPGQVDTVIKDKRIKYVMFTGSVANGRAVSKSAAEIGDGGGFKGVGIEAGGKDPAYVREDADLGKAVDGIVSGAIFNSGQSCCSIERVYAHKGIYDSFVRQVVDKVNSYTLGNPSDPSISLGPVVSRRSADFIRKQVAEAVKSGAKPLIDEKAFPAARADSNFVSPQVLVNVNHSMDIMMSETFGPVIPIMKVNSDAEAVALMNDSPYGLTASVWSSSSSSPQDQATFEHLVDQIEAGTVFLNNADNLDPGLAWSGWKDSGRGVSLSKLGFEGYVKTKSVNIVV